MNKQINDLMEAAFQEIYGDPVIPEIRERAIEQMSDWAEKFAELVAADCNERVQRYIAECGEIASLPDYVLEHPYRVES